MRKWQIYLILLLPILLWGASQLPQTALGSTDPTLDLSSASGLPGDLVTIQLTGEQLNTLRGLSLAVTYDSTVLYPVYCGPASLTEEWELACSTDNGQLRLAMVGQDPITGNDGTLVEVVFQISYAVYGDRILTLAMTDLMAIDTNASPLNTTTSDGHVNIGGWAAHSVYLPLCVR